MNESDTPVAAGGDETVDSDGRHYYHHGRSPAAWVGSGAVLLAFIVGFFALVPAPNPTIGWIAVGIAAVGLIGAVILRAAGYGQGSRRA